MPSCYSDRDSFPTSQDCTSEDVDRATFTLAGCWKTLSTIPLTPFLARKGEDLYLRDTLRLPAEGQSPSALPLLQHPAKGAKRLKNLPCPNSIGAPPGMKMEHPLPQGERIEVRGLITPSLTLPHQGGENGLYSPSRGKGYILVAMAAKGST